jgi:hypothetical protein
MQAKWEIGKDSQENRKQEGMKIVDFSTFIWLLINVQMNFVFVNLLYVYLLASLNSKT